MTIAQIQDFAEALLPLVPLLTLLAALLVGRYPGCEAVVRLSERVARAARPGVARAANWALPAPGTPGAAAGGLVIAFGIARRPPPLAP